MAVELAKSTAEFPVPKALLEQGVTIIIPALNEETIIQSSIEQVRDTIRGMGIPYEIIVVNDGSRDRTGELAEAAGAQVISHPVNRGYGASLKSGIRAARHPWIAITDADGTYPIADLPRLLEQCGDHDMVVGSRTGEHVKIPFLRRPAKWFITRLANYLSGHKIPDLNSGLRVFRREIADRFFHLFPEGFSFTTTITVASLCNNYRVKFLPINYFKRVGTSTISPLRDFLGFSLLVVRLVTYFKPLNVFLPASLVMFTIGFAKAIVDLVRHNAFGVGSALIMLAAVQIGFMGLLADLILRRTKL